MGRKLKVSDELRTRALEDVLKRYYHGKRMKLSECVDKLVEEYPEFDDYKVNSLMAMLSTANQKISIHDEEEKVFHGEDVGVENEESRFRENEDGKSAVYTIETTNIIDTLDKALEKSGVDMDVWEVAEKQYKTWTTTMKLEDTDQSGNKTMSPVTVQNYGWTLRFRRKVMEVSWDDMIESIRERSREVVAIAEKRTQMPGSGVGLAVSGDFHFGAYVDQLKKTSKFSFDILQDYLRQAADEVNKLEKEEVHAALLGDFIESFTGLNHRNSWKGLDKGMHGVMAADTAAEMLFIHFLSRINNLKSVYIVSGNHDRVTEERDGDEKGQIGWYVAKWLRMYFQLANMDVGVEYDPLVLSVKIDGIGYVFTHGHHGLSKKDPAKLVLDYGFPGIYNVIFKAHIHSRKNYKTLKKKLVEYEGIELIDLDDQDYRVVTIPSFFTGNFFSESLGFSSSAGFQFVERMNDRVKLIDYSL